MEIQGVEAWREELDPELYQTVDEAFLDQGARSVIGFEKEHSLENAFFIVPETRDSLTHVLYVHASVNLLNSFLPEIASTELGASKERVNRIEGVLKEMLKFLDEERDITEADVHPEDLLDMPYSLEVVSIVTGKKRRV